jgi:predicted permease
LTDRESLRRLQVDVSEGGRGFSQLRGTYKKPLWLLMGIVGLVLLIACVNIANLLLARALSRRKEVAIRLALGASSWRLVAQLLTESLTLALLGGIFGLAVARAGISLLLRMTQVVDTTVEIDGRVLLFTMSLCIVTGILFGLIPALRAVDVALLPALKAGTDHKAGFSALPVRWNWGKVFVAIQIALSVWVLFTAGLLVRSLKNLRNVDIGMVPENVLLIRVDQISGGYKTEQQRAQYCEQIANRFSSLPGVNSVTYSQNGLFFGNDSLDSIKVEGFVPRSSEDENSPTDRVGPNYFTTMHIPIVSGREIDARDTEFSARVAVINQSWARFYFGKADPIGRKISVIDVNKVDTYQIAGIVADARDEAVRTDAGRRYYLPIAQSPDSLGATTFLVRVSGNPESLMGALRKSVNSFNINVPVLAVRILTDRIDETMQSEVTISRISGFFASMALLLACIGLYGVMAYTVARKTRTIGIRMALGAQRQDVLWLMLWDAMKLVVIGLIVGIPVALGASSLLSSFLYGLKSTDPASLFVVIVILATVALTSSYLPARRATKVDPLTALREE